MTSRQELDDLRVVVERDLRDAEIDALSADRRFATAYNAALQLGSMVIAASGYRRSLSGGHHELTFHALALALASPEASGLADYYDLCRRKRNDIDYFHAYIASDAEVNEILENTERLRILVEAWLAATHPQLI